MTKAELEEDVVRAAKQWYRAVSNNVLAGEFLDRANLYSTVQELMDAEQTDTL